MACLMLGRSSPVWTYCMSVMTVRDDSNYSSPLSACCAAGDSFVRVAQLVNDGTDKDLGLMSLVSTAIIRVKVAIALMSSQSDGREAACPRWAWVALRAAGGGLRVARPHGATGRS